MAYYALSVKNNIYKAAFRKKWRQRSFSNAGRHMDGPIMAVKPSPFLPAIRLCASYAGSLMPAQKENRKRMFFAKYRQSLSAKG